MERKLLNTQINLHLGEQAYSEIKRKGILDFEDETIVANIASGSSLEEENEEDYAIIRMFNVKNIEVANSMFESLDKFTSKNPEELKNYFYKVEEIKEYENKDKDFPNFCDISIIRTNDKNNEYGIVSGHDGQYHIHF